MTHARDADLLVEMLDAWLEAWTWLSKLEAEAGLLADVPPPGGPWRRVETRLPRILELIEMFDACGLAFFEAPATDRRRTILEIGGSLRQELATRLEEYWVRFQDATEEWRATIDQP